MGCTNLKEISLPRYLERIGLFAFAGMTNLEKMIINNPIPPIIDISYGSSMFESRDYKDGKINKTLFVPNNSKELYMSKEIWKDFQKIEELSDIIDIDTIPYITFHTDEEQIFSISKKTESFEYSINNGEWNLLDDSSVVFGGIKGDLRLRGKSNYGTAISSDSCSIISFLNDSEVFCSGDIRTLVDYEYYSTVDCSNARFCNLFKDCKVLVSPPDLPITDLASYCYYGMFDHCTKLSIAPELPAKKLAKRCYYGMFNNCENLSIAPELPATELAERCYSRMFLFCTSLLKAPELPATKLAEYCYASMFKSCHSLIQAPELLAMELSDYCYSSMFMYCRKLKEIPYLPATELTKGCYQDMFRCCEGLEKTQENLPAETLREYCYWSMYTDCKLIKKGPQLPATKLADFCYEQMFAGCSSLEIAPDLPALILEDGCYNLMFKNCTNLKYIYMMATDINDSCVEWVKNVSPTGTFIKNNNAIWNNNGVVPEDWIVETTNYITTLQNNIGPDTIYNINGVVESNKYKGLKIISNNRNSRKVLIL